MLNSAKSFLFIALILVLFSCRMPDNFGFMQPFTLSTVAPDGPPEYKAGWYAGCRSAMGFNAFANGIWYKSKKGAEFGNGVYQHDPGFQTGWGQGYVGCYTYNWGFVNNNANKFGPLQ